MGMGWRELHRLSPGHRPHMGMGTPGLMLCWRLVHGNAAVPCWHYRIRSSKTSVNARTACGKEKPCLSALPVPTPCHQQSSR